MKKHILVVDDDHEVRNYLAMILEAKGYDVTAVETGNDALVKMKSSLVDLVVLDVLLPDGTGLDFCREIKGMNPVSPVPVVMLSSVVDETIVQHAIKRGADDYITKPPPADRLLERIQELLNKFETGMGNQPKTAFA